METLITLTQGNTSIQLPLINILRLSTVYLRQYLDEYRQGHNTTEITEFFKWVRKEKLKVADDATVLL